MIFSKEGFIYLGSPYTHSDPAIMQHRYECTMQATAKLLQDRKWTYSPIVHCHEMAVKFALPRDFDFWRGYNFAMLSRARIIYVLALDGFEESKGLQGERAFAQWMEIPEQIIPA